MAQSDYNVRQAESHQRDAASYIRQAQGYDRDVEYYTREGQLITRLIWKHPDLARLKGYEGEWVLDKIEGDRYGGSPAPTSSRSSNYNN